MLPNNIYYYIITSKMPVKVCYGAAIFNVDVTASLVEVFGSEIFHIPSGDINR